jgi:cytochrome c peroxidase
VTRSPLLPILVAALGAAVLGGCPKAGDKKTTEPVTKRDAGSAHTLPPDDTQSAELPPAPPLPPVPRGLPPRPALQGVTPEAVALGELLFHDARLSSTAALACSTCHDPARGYAGEIQATAAGQQNLRRTPTLVNLAWVAELGWDGRYGSTDSFLAVHVRGQLGEDFGDSLPRIASLPVYRMHFARLTAQILAEEDPGGSPQETADRRQAMATMDPVNAIAARRALSAFVLTRYAGDSPWDRVESAVRKPEPGAALDPLLAGYLLFAGKAQCGLCHTPPLYTDGGYHAVTVGKANDPGRGFVEKKRAGSFRTPTLRGAESRGRFFHTGDATSLEQVVDSYIALANAETRGPQIYDPLVSKIRISPEERGQLITFLRALSATTPAPAKPALP